MFYATSKQRYLTINQGLNILITGKLSIIKILYIGNTGSQNKLTMILSDYTKNQLLTSDSTHRSQIDDQLPNHIPFDTAIRIFLWDENAEQAQGLKEGDVVHFKDLHPRLDSFGRYRTV